METENQFLGTERIGKLMRQYAIPCIISLLVGALYNIVDQIFRRQLPWLLRQRRQHGGVPTDRGGAGYRCYGRRRLLRLCQYGAGQK